MTAGVVVRITTSSSESQRPDALEVLLDLATDLTASLGALDRYGRLLAAVRRLVPYDAACLLWLQGDELVPLAAHGLVPAALERPYPRHRHPRLDAILRSPSPLLFPHDSVLPDPFDGLLTADPHALERIHACLGCALTADGEVVGALTADALDPDAFDGLDARVLATLGALAGAAIRTASLIEALERKAERGTRVARELQRSADESGGAAILGTGGAIAALLSEISVVASSDLPVLVTGETGVGKELVARHVHAGSRRREEAIIHVNCAALPESVAESELFGHVAGAFTGAVRDRAGKFEVADGGSLFLDEIGELPLSLQPKLLRALQQGEIQRIGSDRLHRVDVRIIAATNRDLISEVERGRFRADLYHRLAVYPIRVPALRERREDIPLLATHFADSTRRRLGLGPLRLGEDVRERLAAADWPGNVRELENVVNRAVLRAAAGRPAGAPIVVGLAHVDVAPGATREEPPVSAGEGLPGGPLREQVEELERKLIREAVERCGGNQAAAARELGMHRANLHHLSRRLGLKG
ncbi:MAG: nitric oxide reductase transcriptional regulator NorR [Holophagales bacterium]|nr:nitric oxide reductase transcriptional regulator NorR [Holophagales bacterium]